MPAFNLRLAHYPSCTPILLEVSADASMTAQELRAQIEARFWIEDTCRMRTFGKWYFEVNGTTQFIEIVSSDSDSLSSLDITDEAILYLEGPLLDAQESSGKAIALQPAEPQSIKGELPKRMLQVECQQLAKRYHAQYPDKPLEALWQALIDKSIGVDVVMAIVEDPRCGLNRTSTATEGKFTSQVGAAVPVILNRAGGCTPLLIATLAGRVDVVQRLVAEGVSTKITDTSSGRSALHVASQIGCRPIIEILLAKGADVNATDKDGWSPLHHAVSSFQFECIEPLISKGADVNAADNDGRTPLHHAANNGHHACIELLLSKGADVNAADNYGRTPLHHAASNDHHACIELLLSKGADVNAATEVRIPLHHVASSFQFECIEPLISKGADTIDVDAIDSEGLTALQQAALHRQPDAMRALILRGANLNVLDNKGRTLMHLATAFPSSSLIDLFNKAAFKQRQQLSGAIDGDRDSHHQNHLDPQREHNTYHQGPNNNNDQDNDINSTTLNTNDTQRGHGQLITVRFAVEESDAIKSTQISPNATIRELRLRFAAYELVQDSSQLKWLIFREGATVDISRTEDTEALAAVGIVDKSVILLVNEEPI